MIQPILAVFFGGWEIVLILAMLLIFGAGAVVLVIVLVVRANKQKPPTTQPFTVGAPPVANLPRDLEQELRMLAKLRDEGVITEEDFNLKKKAVLGI